MLRLGLSNAFRDAQQRVSRSPGDQEEEQQPGIEAKVGKRLQ